MIKSLLSIILAMLLNNNLLAQNFASGSLSLLRVGNGTSAINNTSAPVFLDEYSTNGNLIQTIAIPNSISSPHKLVLTGNSINQGFITRSSNGQYIVFGGYDTTTGGTSPSSSLTINRTLAFVDYLGNVDLSTSVNIDMGAIRTAASIDGTSVWFAGEKKGTIYALKGDTGKTIICNDITNSKCLMFYGSQLYLSTAQGSNLRVGKIGEGICTSGLVAYNGLAGLPTTGSPNQYFFADLDPSVPGYDVLYIADNLSGTGLQKYSKVGTNWVSNGNIPVPVTATGLKGLTASAIGNIVTIYSNTASTLYKLTDTTGYNVNIFGTFTNVAEAGLNKAFTSVCFSPVAPLPVQLVSFNGRVDGNKTDLWWTTVSEKDIQHYNIEYSLDGKNFKYLSSVEANNAGNYFYSNLKSLGNNVFYRLNVIERNGKSTYSNILLLKNYISVDVKIMPNPATNYINIIGKDITTIELINEQGKIVFKQESVNSNSVSIPTTGYTKGSYFVRITDKNNSIKTEKLIIK